MDNNLSPTPDQVLNIEKKEDEKKEELFDFGVAMKKVLEGKKICRKEWNTIKEYGEIKDEKLTLHKGDGFNHPWIISTGDLMGIDWFIIK